MSDSVQPHRRQPTRLPRPWDSPGKNTGVGCHFLLQCIRVKSESEVAQSCLTLSDPMDCSPPCSSIHGIFQARVLEWGAIAFSDITCSAFIIVILLQNCCEFRRPVPRLACEDPDKCPVLLRGPMQVLLSFLNRDPQVRRPWGVLESAVLVWQASHPCTGPFHETIEPKLPSWTASFGSLGSREARGPSAQL